MGKLEYYTTLPLMLRLRAGARGTGSPRRVHGHPGVKTWNISFLQARDGAAHEMRIGAGDSAGDQTLDGIETILNFGPLTSSKWMSAIPWKTTALIFSFLKGRFRDVHYRQPNREMKRTSGELSSGSLDSCHKTLLVRQLQELCVPLFCLEAELLDMFQ